jgi:hypothetical protein
MSVVIATVLKKGPEYGVDQAHFLHNQLKDYEAVCLTDIPVPGANTLPLRYNYPGWWSKLNLFDPENGLAGKNLLFMDLDTLITGDLTDLMKDLEARDKMTMLTDINYEQAADRPLASGIMYLPAHCRDLIWKSWLEFDPKKAMRTFVQHPRAGDQGFIAHVVGDCQRFQDIMPRKILSYINGIATPDMPGFSRLRSKGNGKIPQETKIVCFHGQPRPWHVDYKKLLAAPRG